VSYIDVSINVTGYYTPLPQGERCKDDNFEYQIRLEYLSLVFSNFQTFYMLFNNFYNQPFKRKYKFVFLK